MYKGDDWVMEETNNTPEKIKKKRKVAKRYTQEHVDYYKMNYKSMPPRIMAANMGLPYNTVAVIMKRDLLALGEIENIPNIRAGMTKANTKANPEQFVATLDDKGRHEYFAREALGSSRYKAVKGCFSDTECTFYVDRYADFMTDATVETMTSMEKDTLHRRILAEIRKYQYMKEEKDNKEARDKNPNLMIINRSREIKECEEIIAKCDNSLNVERQQRLKNASDQAITFSNLIRDLKNPSTRRKAGIEAAMFRYMEQVTYNDKLGKNIISGNDKKFKIGENFKDGRDPKLSANFTETVDKIEKKQKKREEPEDNGDLPSLLNIEGEVVENGGKEENSNRDKGEEEPDIVNT